MEVGHSKILWLNDSRKQSKFTFNIPLEGTMLQKPYKSGFSPCLADGRFETLINATDTSSQKNSHTEKNF